MFNFNLDLKDVDNILKNPAAIVGLFLVMIAISILFGMSLASSDPRIVCAEQIKVVFEQRKLLTNLETEKAQCISKGETSCIEREQRICRQEKQDLKTTCDRLIEEVITGRGGD